MPTIIVTVATYAAFIIAGGIVALNAIAPLTKTNWDNKFLAFLVFVHDKILALLIPTQSVAVAADKIPASAPVVVPSK